MKNLGIIAALALTLGITSASAGTAPSPQKQDTVEVQLQHGVTRWHVAGAILLCAQTDSKFTIIEGGWSTEQVEAPNVIMAMNVYCSDGTTYDNIQWIQNVQEPVEVQEVAWTYTKGTAV